VAITPQEIETKQFAIGLRGFDQQEVTAFLKSVAGDYKSALEHADGGGGGSTAPAADPYAAMGDEVAAVLRSARDAAGEVRKHAEEEAEALLSKARQEAGELEATAKRHLEEADNSANENRRRSEEAAAAAVAQAKGEAEEIVAAAKARYEQLIRDEQDLGGRLRAIKGDIESSLDRIPAPPSDQGHQDHDHHEHEHHG
jgi:cell division initiation protein